MSNNLDKSLDDIISSNPKSRRRSGPRFSGVRKSSAAGNKPSTASKRAVTKEKKKANQQKAVAAAAATGNPLQEYANLADRIIISNLV